MKKHDNTPAAVLLVLCGFTTACMAFRGMNSGTTDMLTGIIVFVIGIAAFIVGLGMGEKGGK